MILLAFTRRRIIYKMSTKKILLYGLSTCPACKKTARLLSDEGVEFEKIEVDLLDSGEQWLQGKEVKKYNPEGTYPTLIISEVIVGFDEDRIKKVIAQ